ncbi:MAG: sigma-70 family RNA polymerase sigma factor [Bacteroidetes bacterium]|nr:MAG: sigma-70 family RNA polymerase sigma factor [Bacteroidota bacterium]
MTKANLDKFFNYKTLPLQLEHIQEEYALLFRQGEQEALAFFYIELHPALSLYANSILQNMEMAEEVASDAFIKIWKHHQKLDSYNAVRAYLYKTVYNGAILARQRSIRRKFIESTEHSTDENIDPPIEQLIRTETYRLIHSALKDLAPGSQKVIKMYFLEGKSSGEIARELKLSRSTVNTQKYLGLAALRKKLLNLFLIFLP